VADIQESRIWVAMAEQDMSVAKYLLENMRPMPVEIIGFHSQQAAEKSIKSLLVYHGVAVKKSHDIMELVEICNENGVGISVDETAGDALTEYAVKTRYWQDLRDFTEDDAKFAVRQAEKIMQDVETYLMVSEEKEK
jgi:HEPN domain-containing protein